MGFRDEWARWGSPESVAFAQILTSDGVAGRIVGVGLVELVVEIRDARLECLSFAFVEGDTPGGKLDESEYRRAITCCTFEHATDDSVVHRALLSDGQVTAVQELGQDGQAVGFVVEEIATHSDSLRRLSRAKRIVLSL